jgi:hypothetical protein
VSQTTITNHTYRATHTEHTAIGTLHNLPAAVKNEALTLCWDARAMPVSSDVVRTLDKAGIHIQVNTCLCDGTLDLGDAIAAPLVSLAFCGKIRGCCSLSMCSCLLHH